MEDTSTLNIRFAVAGMAKSRAVIVSVYLMMLSYYYNLPVVTYSAVGNNQLRLYDVAGLGIMVMYFRYLPILHGLILSKKIFRTVYYFLLWASVTFIFTTVSSIIENKLYWIVQSLLYLFHFWSFFLTAVFLSVVIQDLQQLKRLVTVCLLTASATFFVVLLQNFKIIPFLWSESYSDSYNGFLSGTLGPNKIVLGMTCLMTFAFCMGLLNDKRVTINKSLLITTIGLSGIVLIISGSRTSYLGLAVFLFYFLIRETKSFIYSGIVLFVVIIGVTYINPEVIDKAAGVYQGRVEDKIKNPNELREGRIDDLYEDLGSGRKELSAWYIDLLVDNLIVVPFGKGFNNRLETLSSAHNTYLSLIYEVGIVGVILYCRWLFSFFGLKMQNFPQMRTALKGLVLSMIVTLCFGEHLYVYRPLFGLLGLFLLITTMLAAPIFILKTEDE